MLADRYPLSLLAEALLPREAYHPFPTADERAAWEALPAPLRADAVTAGEGYLDYAYPMLPATRFLDYVRDGNRSRYETIYFQRRTALNALVVAECVEGRGRFVDDIVNGVWCLCEESTWVVPAHNGQLPNRPGLPLPDVDEPYVDLFSGETAGLLAWTCYLLRGQLDAVSPLIAGRVEREMRARIFEPFLAREDFWWLGFRAKKTNNWSPWVCGNMLTAFFLLEDDPARRAAAAHKVLRSLDRFLAVYGPDGGCDEGPSYWGRAGASLFECLEQLRMASDGRIDAFDLPLVAEIGRYIARAHIDGPYYLNFADGSAKISPPGDVVYRFGQRIGDPALTAMGAALQAGGDMKTGVLRSDSLLRLLPAIFDAAERAAAPATFPYLRDVWMPDLQVFVAREGASPRGLYLAAKGGHNDESHNHNDVGQFVVYLDGRPMLVDAGVETYTAKTFSDRRYEIWTMQSAYHNLPTIGDVQQAPGQQHAARDAEYAVTDDAASLSLEIAGAYPEEAGITTWRRTCRLDRGASPEVRITDAFQLARPAAVTMSLLTPCEPEVRPDGILLRDGDAALRLTHTPATVAGIDRIPLTDPRMVGSWGDKLYRIRLSLPEPVEAGTWVMTAARER